MNTRICFIISLLSLCTAYKVLIVFPMPAKSHSILGEGFVNILLDAGHEVTYVTSILIKNATSKLQQIDVFSDIDKSPAADIFNINKLMNKEIDLTDVNLLLHYSYLCAVRTLTHKNVQKLLHDRNAHFDVVMAEWMFSELYSGLASVFNCPLIWSSSMDPHFRVTSLVDEDLNPAYTADIYNKNSPPFTLLQRLVNLWSFIDTKYKKWKLRSLEFKAFEQIYTPIISERGRTLPSFDEVVYNGSLIFGNSHVSAGQAIPLPQNYIPIAGYHIRPNDTALPKTLQNLMDHSKNGVIYFSMGSMLKSKDMPKELKNDFLNLFSTLNQTVIWKFEEKLHGVPENVHILDWVPQQSVLAHPKCVLFITHGGLLSIVEALHFAVPIIGIPVYADQFHNVNSAVSKGFAKRVVLDLHTPVKLNAAVLEILGNPKYLERAKEMSYVFHHRPVTPSMEVLHWVEHVVRTRGALHLRSPALMVPWYQKMYLDLAALVIFCIISIVVTLIVFLRKISLNRINSYDKNK